MTYLVINYFFTNISGKHMFDFFSPNANCRDISVRIFFSYMIFVDFHFLHCFPENQFFSTQKCTKTLTSHTKMYNARKKSKFVLKNANCAQKRKTGAQKKVPKWACQSAKKSFYRGKWNVCFSAYRAGPEILIYRAVSGKTAVYRGTR